MRLSAFILANREAIMKEWEAFARTCTPASNVMNIADLRDHANEMLTEFAADLDTPQDAGEQVAKSKGLAPDDSPEPTAAEHHGAGRAESGFTVEQMIAEYRALRASVIRLWTKSQGALTGAEIEDLTRFNEAIDQSLAESVTRYSADLNQSKETFLAILGHDLRTPLAAVLAASTFMLDTNELSEPHLTLTSRIASSSTRMVHLVGDLLDFTRSRLGGGIPITRTDVHLGRVAHDVVDELGGAFPERTIRLDARGALEGKWDAARLSQALTNLIGNAIEHGARGSDVDVRIEGSEDAVTVAIHNSGPPIPADQLNGLFNPMKAAEGGTLRGGPSGNLGLGLYIAERIVNAHHGSIGVDSSESDGTTFTLTLPRQPPAGAR